jgi:DNA-binding NtrC family response regulator
MSLSPILYKIRNGANMSRDSLTPIKSVLIIDDDLNMRRSLALILKHAGYRVTSVGQACEVFECLGADKYDLIILDIVTIDDQLTLLPAVKRLYPYLPILIFTAQWSPELAVEIERLGVRAHLVKPVTPKSLLECVDAILIEHRVHS